MSKITLTIVHHRGQTLALGRNAAVKLLLYKSKVSDSPGLWRSTRRLWTHSFFRTQKSHSGSNEKIAA
jgi:hypothetical protein